MEIDIPDNIRGFIDEVVVSFAMWDLLIFSSKKIAEVETPAQIAQMLGRGTEEVLKAVQKLGTIGLAILEKRLDGELAFRLDSKAVSFPALERFWAYNDSQENRLRILSYLLQKKIR